MVRKRHTLYDQVTDGDSFLIETGQDLHLACCNCHESHCIILKKVRKGISVTINRQPRITAALRRENPNPKL